MSGRRIAALAVACAAVVLPARAQEQPEEDRWRALWGVDADTVFEDDPALPVSFRHEPQPGQPGIATLTLTVRVEAGDRAEGCELPEDQTVEYEPADDDDELPHEVERTFDVEVACNGRYRATATATTAPSNERNVPYGPETKAIGIDFAVAVPPAPPTGLKVRVDESARTTATLTWVAPRERPPDFAGYVVERAAPGVSRFERLGTAQGSPFVDAAAPEGVLRYRVHSVRPGAFGDAPVFSSGSPEAVVEIEGSQTVEGPGDSSGSGSSLPPTARFGPGATAGGPQTRTTVDTGFDQSLPFGDASPTGPGGTPGPGASGVVQDFADDEGEGNGLLVPLAVSLVLFVGFLQLRYLLRRASP